jgi:aminoglycoside phosphotransferase family enzyme
MATEQQSSLVESLLRPEAYPDQVSDVELVETYISYLFLTRRYVYKVKKPVDYGFLDFTALDKRHYYCYQEVKLNRRLSPEVYLAVVEIREHNGQYTDKVTVYQVRARHQHQEVQEIVPADYPGGDGHGPGAAAMKPTPLAGSSSRSAWLTSRKP